MTGLANDRDATDRWLWPVDRLGDALTTLADRCGLSRATVSNPVHIEPLVREPIRLEQWLQAAGRRLATDVHAVTARYHQVEEFLASEGPKLLHHPDGFLAVVESRADSALVLGPDGDLGRLSHSLLRAACQMPWERSARAVLDTMLERAEIAPGKRARAAHHIVGSMNASPAAIHGWSLRPLPEAPFVEQMRRAGLVRLAAALIGAHVLQYAAFLMSWWAVGHSLLAGRLSTGWLLAWALLLITTVPLRMCVTWLEGRLGVGLGTLLKRRLLFGAMRMRADTVRTQGAGELLGRSIDAEMVEVSAMRGGIAGALAVLELLLAAAVLAQGAGGWWHVLALGLWLLFTLVSSYRLAGATERWTDSRIALTESMVEVMIGHRTRLVQCLPERWHRGEDHPLWTYLGHSRAIDFWRSAHLVVVPYGWLILSIVTLAPGFIGGAPIAALAVGLGGVLLAQQSFVRLGMGMRDLIAAVIAWRRVAPLFHAAERAQTVTDPDHVAAPDLADEDHVLEAHGLSFRYHNHTAPVFADCDLSIRHGDRVLLRGASGSGKSTLASVLLGHRPPTAGLLLAGGLDRSTLGDLGWQRRITSAVQFHDNRVFSESFLFNLLMGRQWPADADDQVQARTICEELGLGPLIERMPAGLMQLVGDNGWQLSHGERSRLYIARALLQDCDVVILDESLAALDPDNLTRVLDCVRQRARALVLIAHP